MENPYQSSEPAWSGPKPVPEELVAEDVVEALAQTRPWALLCSVMGFLGGVMMVVLGLGVMAVGVFAPEVLEEEGSQRAALGEMPPVLFGAFYIVLSVVYIVPSWVLFRYARRIRALVIDSSHTNLVSALSAQRSFWRVFGALTIVMIVLLGLVFLAMIVLIAAAEF